MRLFIIVCAVSFVATEVQAQPINRADVKPGLIFMTTLPNTRATSQLVPNPALNLASNEGAHPRAGEVTAYVWRGTLNIVQAGKYRFDMELNGTATVRLGGKVIASGTAEGKLVAGTELDIEAGIQPLSITLSPLAKGTPRFELIWRGPGFQAEPIPYFFFGHVDSDGIELVKDEVQRDRGRYLVEENGCVNCHREAKPTLTPRTGTNLSRIAARTNAGYLDAWLKNPHEQRPNTSMPAVFTEDERGAAERYAVVSYLMTLGKASELKEPKKAAVLKSLEDGRRLYQTVGCSTCHGDKITSPPTVSKKNDEEDEKPVAAPHEQVYALGDATAGRYYRLGNVGSKWNVDELAKYLIDPQTLNMHGRMPGMILTKTEANDIATFLVRQKDESLKTSMPPEPNTKPTDFGAATWADAGKAIYTAKGCVNCHIVENKDATKDNLAKAFATLQTKPYSGCNSETPDLAKVPNYRFNANDREAIAAFLKTVTEAVKPSPMYEAKANLKRFGCLNCHNRDGEGGLNDDLEKIMKTLITVENGEEIAPPRLTHVGHKLRSSWLKGVLVDGYRARSWMALRMPQYGENKVSSLVEGLPKLEGANPEDKVNKPTYTATTIEAGRTLTGKTGMGCISCHDISGIAGGGTRGPDLAKTQDRVRYDWYIRWMHQPQRLAPGTKMPQNFIDGKSLFPNIIAGDADKQIEALWAYFSLGQGLPLPVGMDPPKGLTVAVGAKPEILRTFMAGPTGTRPIAVGFPGGTNVVFDAASCRLSYAWAGNFLDAKAVWANRGGNQATLLGQKFWNGPAGFPWAVTTDGVVPDFDKQFEDPAYGHLQGDDTYSKGPRYVRFQNYELDEAGSPSFQYLLNSPESKQVLEVVEKIEALPVTVAPGLKRSFNLALDQQKATWLYFGKGIERPRIVGADGKPAKGEHGEIKAASTRVMIPESGGKLTVIDMVAVPKGAEWHVSDGALLLRIPPGESKSMLQYKQWTLPKDEAVLIDGLK